MTRPTPPTASAPTATAPQVPDLGYQQALRMSEPLARPEEVNPLPTDVLGQVNLFWSCLQAAETAYTVLAQGSQDIWGNAQYPADYRRAQVQEHVTRTLQQQAADLQAAEGHLKTARDLVKRATTPPLLGEASVHELKLMNAREEVRTALEGLQPIEQHRALVDLFEDAMRDGQSPAIAYFIGATDAYKRLLRDPATRIDFAAEQGAMLRRLLPPTAEPYLKAEEALDHLQSILDTALTVRYFTARDNGWSTTLGG